MKPLFKSKLTVLNLKYVIQEVSKLVLSDKEYEVTLSPYSDKRSLPANAQIHVWFPIIAEFIGGDTVTVKARSNIDFGVPILLRHDNDYAVILDYILDKTKFWNMNFEQQEKFIQGIAVTSQMNTKQCNEYRDNLKAYWSTNGLELEYKR